MKVGCKLHVQYMPVIGISDLISSRVMAGLSVSSGPSITKLFLLTLKYLFSLYQKDVDSFIDHKAALDKRKKQMLFKKWSERVYSPVKVNQSLY